MLCIDAEILSTTRPPIISSIPLIATNHELVKQRSKCRIYKLTLKSNESITVSYPFFHFTVVLCPCTIQYEINTNTSTSSNNSASTRQKKLTWIINNYKLGDVSWKEPIIDITRTNVDNDQSKTFVQYIAEWC